MNNTYIKCLNYVPVIRRSLTWRLKLNPETLPHYFPIIHGVNVKMTTVWNFQWQNLCGETEENLHQSVCLRAEPWIFWNYKKLVVEPLLQQKHVLRRCRHGFWNKNWLQKSTSCSYYSENKNFIRQTFIFEVVFSVHAETCLNLVPDTK